MKIPIVVLDLIDDLLGGGDTANRDIFVFGTMYENVRSHLFCVFTNTIPGVHIALTNPACYVSRDKLFFVFTGFCWLVHY